jgi:hypothetical protein
MAANYEKGLKVIISPPQNSGSLLRDSQLEPYAGKIGIITDYYSIQPTGRERFFIYTVRLDDRNREIVLHEDELIPCLK